MSSKARQWLIFAAVAIAAVSPYLQSLDSWADLKSPQAVGVLGAMLAGKVVAFLMKRPQDSV